MVQFDFYVGFIMALKALLLRVFGGIGSCTWCRIVRWGLFFAFEACLLDDHSDIRCFSLLIIGLLILELFAQVACLRANQPEWEKV